MFSNVVYTALAFATEAHKGQVRKGTDIPYIVHPMAVALLAYSYSKDVDLACAGLLHDTVEDTAVTIEDIRKKFGEKVALLVAAVTEESPDDMWTQRKKKALVRVDGYSTNELILKTSDVIVNCQDIMRDYREVGDKLWTRFNQSGKKGNLTDHYILMLKSLKNRALFLGLPFVFVVDINETLHEMHNLFGE
jgi:guanosine-3',5'-bis(diphosphate) 3'-pyrophosphohydrolase